MTDRNNTPAKSPVPVQHAIDAAEELRANGLGEDFARRVGLAEGFLNAVTHSTGKDAPASLQERVSAKVYEHTLRQAGRDAEADVLKNWELLQRARSTLTAPALDHLRRTAPEAHRLLTEVEACDHGGHHHHHPVVDQVLRNATETIPGAYADAAKAAQRSQRVVKRTQPRETPLPGESLSLRGGHIHTAGCGHLDSPANPAPSCGTTHHHDCGHLHGPATPAQAGGAHYHGGGPCSHAHAPAGGHPHAHLEHVRGPKGTQWRGAWWAAAAAGAVGVGAYLSSRSRKPEGEDPALSPTEAEVAKTKEQRAEDIAYTINHALACTATDFIDPYFGDLTQRYLGQRVSIGCSHDHSKDAGHGPGHEHGPGCDHHAHAGAGHLGHWWIGEVVGDFGAVPVTVGMQRYFPSVMDGLRRTIEPVLGGYFRKGAERSTKSWAEKRGVSADSPEYKQHMEAVYRHEVDHLPQALVWTASSIAINLTTQRLIGNTAPLWQLATGKAVGASISAALVVGGRGLAPEAARKWDGFTSKNVFLPATRVIGRVFGIEERSVERMADKEERLADGPWESRVRQSRTAVPGEATSDVFKS